MTQMLEKNVCHTQYLDDKKSHWWSIASMFTQACERRMKERKWDHCVFFGEFLGVKYNVRMESQGVQYVPTRGDGGKQKADVSSFPLETWI